MHSDIHQKRVWSFWFHFTDQLNTYRNRIKGNDRLNNYSQGDFKHPNLTGFSHLIF